MADRAKAVQESFEDRQTGQTDSACGPALRDRGAIEQRKREQAAKGLDDSTYFVLCKLTEPLEFRTP